MVVLMVIYHDRICKKITRTQTKGYGGILDTTFAPVIAPCCYHQLGFSAMKFSKTFGLIWTRQTMGSNEWSNANFFGFLPNPPQILLILWMYYPPSNDHISQQTGKKEIMHSKLFGEGICCRKGTEILPSLSETFCLGQFRGQKQPFSPSQTFCLGFIPVPKTAISVGGQPFQITFASNLIRLQKRAMFPASFFSRQRNCWLGGPSPRRLRDGVAKGKPWGNRLGTFFVEPWHCSPRPRSPGSRGPSPARSLSHSRHHRRVELHVPWNI